MLRNLLACFALSIGAAALSSCASSPSLGEGLSDIGANAELKAVLFADRSHDYSDVDLTLFEGRLMLTGAMRSEEGHAKLLENTQKARGVDEVIDEILIAEKTPFSQGLEDSRIDAAIRARLIGADDVSSGSYKLSVSNSVAYILGAAPDQEELNRAIELARTTKGVANVVNHALVRPPLQ